MKPTIVDCEGCVHRPPVGFSNIACQDCQLDVNSYRPTHYAATPISAASDTRSLKTPTEELKACPFCGGKAAISSWKQMDEYSVYCTVCNAVAGDYEDSKEKAIARWNKRFSE